jgi:hypothetical protein
MPNETIGKLEHHCGTVADVRKDRGGKLYLMCANCGQLKYNLSGGQDYILNNAVMLNARGELPAETEAEDNEKSTIPPVKSGKYETVVLENNDEKPAKNPVNVTEKKATKIATYNGIESMAL